MRFFSLFFLFVNCITFSMISAQTSLICFLRSLSVFANPSLFLGFAICILCVVLRFPVVVVSGLLTGNCVVLIVIILVLGFLVFVVCWSDSWVEWWLKPWKTADLHVCENIGILFFILLLLLLLLLFFAGSQDKAVKQNDEDDDKGINQKRIQNQMLEESEKKLCWIICGVLINK